VLLNDPTYVEAARAFAERIMLKSNTDAGRVEQAYQLALCRVPLPEETGVLLKVQQQALKRFVADRAAADKLLAIGHSKRKAGLDSAELASWTAVASMILNLDEAISKP
jgi:hypothetical protein